MNQKETFAVSITKPKIAALIYDRVWSGLGKLDIPPSIAFNAFGEFVNDTKNVGVSTGGLGLQAYDNRTGETIKNLGIQGAIAALNLIEFEQAKGSQQLFHPFFDEDIRTRAEITFRTLLNSEYGINAVPVFESQEAHDRAYIAGDSKVIISVIENVSLIDDDKLEWDQILEFRKDVDSKKKFLKLKHWFDKEMLGKSEQFIIDEISIRLEEYEWSIKKHGFQTITGAISTLLDYRTLLAGIGTTVVTLNFFNSLPAILAGGGIIISGAAVKLTESLLQLQDIKFGKNSEVSFIHEIKTKF